MLWASDALEGRHLKNWAWGLFLITLTIIIHAIGIGLMTLSLQRIRTRLECAAAGLHHLLAVFIALIGGVGLLLGLLHGIEAAVWAAAYWWLSAAPSLEEAMLYSIDSRRSDRALRLSRAAL